MLIAIPTVSLTISPSLGCSARVGLTLSSPSTKPSANKTMVWLELKSPGANENTANKAINTIITRNGRLVN